MGRKPKKPKPLFRHRLFGEGWGSKQDFQDALIETAIEGMRGQPCHLCHAPGTIVGTWIPTAECSRRLGAPEGKRRVIVYSLCDACAALPDASEQIEDEFLAVAENRARALKAGFEMDENIGYLPDCQVPDWVREVIETRSDDWPFLFTWKDNPRIVQIRLTNGTIATWTEDEDLDPELIPPPPADWLVRPKGT